MSGQADVTCLPTVDFPDSATFFEGIYTSSVVLPHECTSYRDDLAHFSGFGEPRRQLIVLEHLTFTEKKNDQHYLRGNVDASFFSD